MNAPRKLKVGMVGVGGFGAYRRERMRETGLFELVAAYDLNAEALARCQREDGAKPVGSYKELLSAPGIEAILISTGASFHAEQALPAMEKGLHVFVEKPLCSTPSEVEALAAMQKKTGLVVGVGHHDHSRDAVSMTIKEMIDTGQLGKVVSFEFTTAHSGGLVMKPGEWRADRAKNPGGMLFQCGVHAIHELLFYFGAITRVSCMMRYDVHTSPTADVALCHLQFASGLIGALNAYHVTPYRHTLFVYGTRVNLYRFEGAFDEPKRLFAQETKLDGKKEPEVRVAVKGATDDCGNLRSFHRAIREGGRPYPSLFDGARAVQAVFAADESARLGRPVELRAL
jgi:predicted dehydrogenase